MAKIKIDKLSKNFNESTGFFNRLLGGESQPVQAVTDVSLDVNEGEIIGIAGESGSGKTTLAKTLMKLYEPSSGEIYLDGTPYSEIGRGDMKEFRRNVQMILQDPFESLNPRFTVLELVMEPLLIHDIGETYEERRDIVKETLKDVGLRPPEQYLDSFPRDLSGGEQQRVCLSRALVLDPDVLVADEPVSMLDVSIRAGVLNLLQEIHKDRGTTMIIIGHDLAMLRYLCQRLAIMYLGEIVEVGPAGDVIDTPSHPYTEELLKAVPDPTSEGQRTRAHIEGTPPSVENPPSGCRFHTRCPFAREACKEFSPGMYNGEGESKASCFRRESEHQYWDSPPLPHTNTENTEE